MNAMMMLVRREFWEHRVLVIAPLVLCVLYLVMCVLAGANVHVEGFHLGGFASGNRAAPDFAYFVMSIAFTTMLTGLMAIVTFFYLCDCLYSERKDRSILFWKSLPVSDTRTVLSKLFVALIAVPLVVYALALVTNLLAYVIFAVSFPRADVTTAVSSQGSAAAWAQLNGYLLIDVFVLALWFAPVVAYQLVVSVLAPRAVFVWTVLPPVVLAVGERVFFGSWNLMLLFRERLGGVMDTLHRTGAPGLQGLLRSVDATPLLSRPDLWIGVAIAIALVFLAIRVRRHSDDT